MAAFPRLTEPQNPTDWERAFMRMAIFGSGYVGLVTGASLADVGHDVTCVDIDADRVRQLQRSIIPIFEPGLSELVRSAVGRGRLHFSTDAAAAIQRCDLLFIAVGTPSNGEGAADLTHVIAVARSIGTHINGFKIVIEKSTVPVGTGDLLARTISETMAVHGLSHDFEV